LYTKREGMEASNYLLINKRICITAYKEKKFTNPQRAVSRFSGEIQTHLHPVLAVHEIYP